MPKIYLTGNTFPLREEIKAAGGRWDKERKQWYCTPAERPAMLALARRAQAMPPKRARRGEAAQPDDNTKVIGEALDPGDRKTLWWLAWTGRLTTGNNAGALFAKLVTRDGRKFLWKPAKKVTILRRFETPLPLCGLLAQLQDA
jgi:hypothetical protein